MCSELIVFFVDYIVSPAYLVYLENAVSVVKSVVLDSMVSLANLVYLENIASLVNSATQWSATARRSGAGGTLWGELRHGCRLGSVL